MSQILEELSDLCYVADRDTYELLFLNAAGKSMLGLKSVDGRRCYEALHGRTRPCDGCTNAFLREDAFYTWEQTNTLLDRHYLIKEKAVNWQGKRGRLEIALDLTEKELQHAALKNALETESMILSCVKWLQAAGGLDCVLGKIGAFWGAQRTSIMEVVGKELHFTYEWCARGVPSRMGEKVDTVSRALTGQSACAAAPIYAQGILCGYIAVENPARERAENIRPFLETLGDFISIHIQNKQYQQKLERLSYFDTLTGARNRNAFVRDSAHLAASRGKEVGVVYLDINGMREINDVNGHAAGDMLLADAVKKMCAVFGEACLYRIGGDEFLILCLGIAAAEFEPMVWKLKDVLTDEKGCAAAIGYQWERSCTDIRDLVTEANEGMFRDKKRYYLAQAEPRRRVHRYEDPLGLTKPGALEEMMGENRFPVYFQPKVCVKTRDIIGAEALIRYRSPEGELLAPDAFIPLLEQARLIALLDFYVFDFVTAKLEQWRAQGRSVVPVSVNFSRQTILAENFLKDFLQVWEKSRVPKYLLEIEVTESMRSGADDTFFQSVHALRQAGFSVSIDDFGAKYANLSLLANASFDVLKLDKSLLFDLSRNQKAREVIQSISDICRKTGIDLIVEGVETEEQLDILREIGCEGAQGYLFSRPLPQEEFERGYI